MKITLKDFNFAGHHFDEYEIELSNIHSLEEIEPDLIEEHVVYTLLDFINFNSSFYEYEESEQ